jgi:hypothetical protein
MRKYLYLVTEHEESDLVGTMQIVDKRFELPEKNEEGPYTVFDHGKQEFRDLGKKVGCGYADFADEEDYENRIGDVIQKKIREIDQKWLNKAGVELE